MTRRARLNRRMFREPSYSKSGPIIAVRRGQVVDDYANWVQDTHDEDREAFRLAWAIVRAERQEAYAKIYAELPPGLRSRVDEMVRRISKSARNRDAAYEAARPRRSRARSYTPRGGR